MPKHGNNKSAVARELELTPSAVSRLLAKNEGGSLRTARKVCEVVPEVTLPEILEGAELDERALALRELPGFRDAEKAAKALAVAQSRTIDDWAWDWAARFVGTPPLKSVDAELLLSLANTAMKQFSPPAPLKKKKTRKSRAH